VKARHGGEAGVAARTDPILASEAKGLLRVLCQHGIPLTLSVPFLLRAQRAGIQETADLAGCHRSLFRMTLEGRRTPPPALISVLEEKLGCDPWRLEAEVREQKSPVSEK